MPTSGGFDAAPDRPAFFQPGKKLYERQARALGRMLAIDDGDVDFTEEEMSDHALASGIGWTLKVMATRLTLTPTLAPRASRLAPRPSPQPELRPG